MSLPRSYFGTEVGVSQDRDVRYADGSGHPGESRLPMRWGDDQDTRLLRFYRELVAFRRASPWLWRGERETLPAEDGTGLYAVAIADPAGRTEVVMHLGDGEVALPTSRLTGRSMALATGESVRVDGADLRLGPWSGAAFTG